MRSFLLANFPAILQFLVRISDVLKSHHELLYVIEALVQHFLNTHAHMHISILATFRDCSIPTFLDHFPSFSALTLLIGSFDL